MARLVFLCCHLSGTGHLVRTLALARAARGRGHTVSVISGGRPLEHLAGEVVQLPPVTVDGLDFATLRRADGQPADAAWMDARRAALDAALDRPDALITELYPFGRRMLGDEFRHAIARAHGAAIVASVRDIPEPKPKRLAEVAARLRADYDAVLVHGDAGFLPLSVSWPLPGDLTAMIHHTGYVGRAMPAEAAPTGEVLVSAGGGTLGGPLIEAAVRAAALSARPWRVLIGGADAAARAAALRATHPAANLAIEPVRPDFPTLLAGAACSVSLCGYNTAVELAGCRTPAILVPSDEGGEREQDLRATALAAFPGIRRIAMAGLDPAVLAAEANRLADGPRRAPLPLAIDDGTRAIAGIEAILAGRRA